MNKKQQAIIVLAGLNISILASLTILVLTTLSMKDLYLFGSVIYWAEVIIMLSLVTGALSNHYEKTVFVSRN